MKFATLIAAVFSLLAIGSLLVRSQLPVFPDWTGPAHFSSSVLLAVVFAAVLVTWCKITTVETAWLTVVSGSALVVILEVVQRVNPVRSFQLEDILFGVAGISTGAVVAYLFVSALGKIKFAALAIISTVAAGVFLHHYSAQGFAIAKNLSCGIEASTASSWDSVLLDDFSQQSGIATSDKLRFCADQGDIVTIGGIRYTADLRISLDGLADAVREHRRFVMGVQFETSQQSAVSEIFSLTWSATANRYFARVYRSAKHLTALLQFNSGERTVSSLTNRVERGKVQELFMVYDGKQQTTWLNGEIVSMEINHLNIPTNKNVELVLNIRQTADRKGWVPFKGDIMGIYLGTQPVNEADMRSIFSD